MSAGLVLAVVFAFAFAFTNGVHDASNAVAALVATRAARPLHAVAMAAVFNMLGPLLVGTAVADTLAGIVTVKGAAAIELIGAGLVAAVVWNCLTWWRGLPSSSGHALVGGLVGAGLAQGGTGAINWGGMDGLHPVGVIGTVVALAVSPVLGALAGGLTVRGLRHTLRRASMRWQRLTGGGEWVASAGLAFSHGANDAQKTVGMVAALLVAGGQLGTFGAPTWLELSCAAVLTLGTLLGGWRIMRTVGRGIYKIQPLDGLTTQTASAGVIFGASLLGGPVSTTHVVASSVVGVGIGRGRPRHVHWEVVREMGVAWLITLPVTAALAALTLVVWRTL
jgi:PiT family inorganic phosphate transporter